MRRLTISVDDDLADAFEALVQANSYENRSEAFRDLLREKLGQQQLTKRPHGPCVASLSYVYDHHERQLAMRLADMQHHHHDLTVSTMHAHLDHNQCIETLRVTAVATSERQLWVNFTQWRRTASGKLTFKGRISAMNSKSGPSGPDPSATYAASNSPPRSGRWRIGSFEQWLLEQAIPARQKQGRNR